MSNSDNSRLSLEITQQIDGLYDINCQITKCSPSSAFETLKRVEIAVSNLPSVIESTSVQEDSGVS